MPRRNRVDPLGDLHAIADRQGFTGNRGCLVNADGELVSHHNGNLWILCRLRYRGWHHPLAAPRTWTPLFFLDDAVGLAAGHRPCGLCRRLDHLAYRAGVTAGLGRDRPVLADELNARLAAERLRRGRGLDRAGDRIIHRADVDTLPTGAVILGPDGAAPHLVTERHLQPFGFGGWGAPIPRPTGRVVEVVTPPTSVLALANGFRPTLHVSASRAVGGPRPSATVAGVDRSSTSETGDESLDRGSGPLRRLSVTSPIGRLLLVADDAGLTRILFADQDLPDIGLDPAEVPEAPDDPILATTAAQLAEYFAGERTEFDLPLHLEGTEFQRTAWLALADIPYGQTTSYGKQAKAIGKPDAFRAVGAANGANPIPIVLPCHRVVGSDGSLTGFGGGLDVKQLLLDLERGTQRLPLWPEESPTASLATSLPFDQS